MAVVPCITTSLFLVLGVYFSYVPRLVDFVADSDVESLVLSGSSATHLLAASRARY